MAQWSPGREGKGFLDPEGNLHLWPVDHLGNPHHIEYAQELSGKDLGRMDYRMVHSLDTNFTVDPTGAIRSSDYAQLGGDRNPAYEQQVAAMHPQLHPAMPDLENEYDLPGDTDWHFSSNGYRDDWDLSQISDWYFVTADWHVTSNNLGWTPDQPGKALVTPEGEVHTWNIDNATGQPNHVDVAGERGLLDNRPQEYWSEPFGKQDYVTDHLDSYYIEPDGYVYNAYGREPNPSLFEAEPGLHREMHSSWKLAAVPHVHWSTGYPCECGFTKHIEEDPGLARTSSKLDHLRGRQDLQTPEAEPWLNYLGSLPPKTDPIMPWMTREWKQGRLVHDPGLAEFYGHGPEVFHKDPRGQFHNGSQGMDYGANYPNDPDRRYSAANINEWADWHHSNHPTRQGVDINSKHALGQGQPFTIEHMNDATRQYQLDKQAEENQHYGEVVHQLPDNWTIRRLRNSEEAQREGAYDHEVPGGMGNCVGGYGGQIESGRTGLYSLRDPNNNPHSTVEITPQFWQDPANPQSRLNTVPESGPPAGGNPAGGILQERVQDHLNQGLTPEQVYEHMTTSMGMRPEAVQKAIDWAQQPTDQRTYPVPLPHQGSVEQIQGKGNREPVPEHKDRLRQWFQSFPEEERPTWGDEGYNEAPLSVDDLRDYVAHPWDSGGGDNEYGLGSTELKPDWHEIMLDHFGNEPWGDLDRAQDWNPEAFQPDLVAYDPEDWNSEEEYEQWREEEEDNHPLDPEWEHRIDDHHENTDFIYKTALERGEIPELAEGKRRAFNSIRPYALKQPYGPEGLDTADYFMQSKLDPHWNPETQQYENEVYPRSDRPQAAVWQHPTMGHYLMQDPNHPNQSVGQRMRNVGTAPWLGPDKPTDPNSYRAPTSITQSPPPGFVPHPIQQPQQDPQAQTIPSSQIETIPPGDPRYHGSVIATDDWQLHKDPLDSLSEWLDWWNQPNTRSDTSDSASQPSSAESSVNRISWMQTIRRALKRRREAHPEVFEIHEPKLAWRDMQHQLLWSPGQKGKGLLTPEGELHTWPDDEEETSHLDYMHQLGLQGNKLFGINEDGSTDEDQPDPHLRSIEPRLMADPNDQDWSMEELYPGAHMGDPGEPNHNVLGPMDNPEVPNVNPGVRRSMLEPDAIDAHIQKHGPYLYHATHPDNLTDIQTNGLRPNVPLGWGGEPSTFLGHPDYVKAFGTPNVRVDLRQLQPHSIQADPDYFEYEHALSDNPDQYQEPDIEDPQATRNSLEIGSGGEGIGSIAYRGPVPPSAIEVNPEGFGARGRTSAEEDDEGEEKPYDKFETTLELHQQALEDGAFTEHHRQSAADPEWLDDYIERNGPYMYHYAADRPTAEAIQRDGLLPHDVTGNRQWHGDVTPRANHVYLGDSLLAATNASGWGDSTDSDPQFFRRRPIFRTDLRKLDPQRMNGDEDQFWHRDQDELNDMAHDSPAWKIPAYDEWKFPRVDTTSPPSHGRWADEIGLNDPEHVKASMDNDPEDYQWGTMAYQGGIPPESLELLTHPEYQLAQDQKMKYLTHLAPNPDAQEEAFEQEMELHPEMFEDEEEPEPTHAFSSHQCPECAGQDPDCDLCGGYNALTDPDPNWKIHEFSPGGAYGPRAMNHDKDYEGVQASSTQDWVFA